jgi:predicted O-methyltransferase YrrM
MTKGTIGLDRRLNDYLVAQQPPEHPALAKLRAATAKLGPSYLQIAPEQSSFLGFLARLIDTRRALEVGTFTGYSAMTVAFGLPKGGKLVACDINKEWTDIARRHWQAAGIADRIELRLGPAADTLAALEMEGGRDSFDFAFIDADKTGYDGYYESALRLVRRGGLIVFDNMLQGGSVADPKDRDADTRAIRAINAKIAGDDRVDRMLVPIGDGMTVVKRL